MTFGTIGQVVVRSTQGRGLSPDEWAELMVGKIIQISDDAPPPIRDQALAYRARLLAVCAHYLAHAARSDRTTVCNRLREAGFAEAAATIERL